jgi:hypothetical protein
MYYPRRKAGCLLLEKADKISAKIQQWKRKFFPSLQLLKNLEVCSSVQTFMFLRTIKTWCSILSKHNVYYVGVQKLKSFTHATIYWGPHNILANNLSRLHCQVTLAQIAEGKKLVEPAEVSIEKENKAYFLDQEYSGLYNEDIWECIECYLNLPDTPYPDENQLNYAYIRELQQQDKQLLALQVKYPDNYDNLQLDDNVDDIICDKKDAAQPNWKIALPESMVVDTVKWFYQVMGHPGEKRSQDTLNQRYYHPRLHCHIEKLKCKDCQKHKLEGCGYGLLPKWEVRIAPWEEVAINLIGPWRVKVNSQQVEFNALTCIDMALNLVELICVDNKTAKHICDKFTQSWFCQYPYLVRCLHNKGGELIGQNFQWLLEIFSIKDVCSSSKNSQSNATCERMHQKVTNVLSTLVNTNPPQNMTQARDIIDDSLATAMHAMQTTVATTLGSTPGALAFSWDMFLNIPLIPDWQAIARTYEHHVNENLWRANRKQRQYAYALGQQVLKKVHDLTNLGVGTEGPYTIEHVRVNGNLTILLREGITERINRRRVLLYRWTIPHTPVKTILSMDCIKVFNFYLWSFFLHLTFQWVVGGVFLGPVSVCSSMAEWVLPWMGRVSCPWK